MVTLNSFFSKPFQSKATTCQKALKNWEETHPDQNPAEAEEIKLLFQVPPIEKLEANVLNTLTNVRKLSLSSNAIEKMVNLPNLSMPWK